eukprot:733234-Rhodomonas_salina.1
MGQQLQPLALGSGRTPVLVSVAVNHACVLTAEDSVVCWGSNANFGPTDFADLDLLSTSQAQAGVKPALVQCFHSHTCAILTDGSLKCESSFPGSRCGGPAQVGDETDMEHLESVCLGRILSSLGTISRRCSSEPLERLCNSPGATI